MQRLLTKYLGWIEYDEAGVVDFPAGVPGFEHERRFLFIRNEAHAPVVFLQSVQSPGLCFLALPAREVEMAVVAVQGEIVVVFSGHGVGSAS